MSNIQQDRKKTSRRHAAALSAAMLSAAALLLFALSMAANNRLAAAERAPLDRAAIKRAAWARRPNAAPQKRINVASGTVKNVTHAAKSAQGDLLLTAMPGKPPLRWRTHPLVKSRKSADLAVAINAVAKVEALDKVAEDDKQAGSKPRRFPLARTVAQQASPAEPLEENAALADPFGDLLPPPPEGALSPRVAASSSPEVILSPPRPLGGKERGRAAPTIVALRSRKSALKQPCDQIYNDRNCCDEASHCKEMRLRRLNDRITDINLDITPSFDPDADSPADALRQQQAKLGGVESRAWKNRRGDIIAQGRLVDYRNTRISIETDSGKVVRAAFHTLSDDDLCYVTAWWGLPDECTLGDDLFAGRNWTPITMTWKASALCHKPLYFEDIALERYGHTYGPFWQPVVSGAHFFLNIAALPYNIGIHPMNECQYALGYYRPGSCAPWLIPPIPLSLRGALLEAGVVTGAAVIIP